MSEIQAFFHMGGYAWYVWPSFLITLVVLVANVWLSRIQFRSALLDAKRRVVAQAKKNNP